MNPFRKKLKNQRTCAIVVEVILAIMLIVNFLGDIDIIPIFDYMQGDEAWKESYPEKIGIFILTLLIFNGVSIRKISKAFNNEEQLKERYIQSTDEREQMIFNATRSASTRIFVLLEMIAIPICGYFSKTIAVTICITTVTHCLIALICERIYRKKY